MVYSPEIFNNIALSNETNPNISLFSTAGKWFLKVYPSFLTPTSINLVINYKLTIDSIAYSAKTTNQYEISKGFVSIKNDFATGERPTVIASNADGKTLFFASGPELNTATLIHGTYQISNVEYSDPLATAIKRIVVSNDGNTVFLVNQLGIDSSSFNIVRLVKTSDNTWTSTVISNFTAWGEQIPQVFVSGDLSKLFINTVSAALWYYTLTKSGTYELQQTLSGLIGTGDILKFSNDFKTFISQVRLTDVVPNGPFLVKYTLQADGKYTPQKIGNYHANQIINIVSPNEFYYSSKINPEITPSVPATIHKATYDPKKASWSDTILNAFSSGHTLGFVNQAHPNGNFMYTTTNANGINLDLATLNSKSVYQFSTIAQLAAGSITSAALFGNSNNANLIVYYNAVLNQMLVARSNWF